MVLVLKKKKIQRGGDNVGMEATRKHNGIYTAVN
jgi:hypothetical protein